MAEHVDEEVGQGAKLRLFELRRVVGLCRVGVRAASVVGPKDALWGDEVAVEVSPELVLGREPEQGLLAGGDPR